MRLFFIIVLLALSFSWNTAKAQGNHDFPQKIQQNWAFPDCSHGKEALIFTRFFMISAEKDSLALKPYETKKEGKNAWRIGKNPAEITEDGILKLDSKSYTACDAAPKIMPKALLRISRYLDRIKEQCTASIENDCARVLFKMADANSDKKLNAAEIKKGLLSVMIFAGLADQQSLNEEDMKNIADNAREEGSKIADDLIAHYDSDKSKSLDYNELNPDKFTPPKSSVLRETLLKSGKIIPLFQIVGATLP